MAHVAIVHPKTDCIASIIDFNLNTSAIGKCEIALWLKFILRLHKLLLGKVRHIFLQLRKDALLL